MPTRAAVPLLVLLALPAPAPAAVDARPAQVGSGSEEEEPLTVGDRVRRDLALPLLPGADEPEGPPHRIFGPEDAEDTPPVVLAWWSLRDPLCRKAEPKLAALAEEFEPRGVRFYLVESNHDELVAGLGDPLERIRRFRREAEVDLPPLLLDRGNVVADELGALCANHVYVIDADRVIRYHGAIDDDPRNRREERTAYLREALLLALDGRSPEEELRRPQGRRIKRAPEGPDAGEGAKKR